MARIRTIKPEFFTSEDIVSMTPLARLFYVSLWCEADKEGRLEWKPGTFKIRYLGGDSCDVSDLAAELIDRELIELYEVNGRTYAQIPTFKEHQVINNRESESIIPRKDADATLTRESGVQAEGKEGRKEGKGRERKEGVVARGSRLPQDFTPDFQFAVDAGIHNTLEEASKFRDYWKSQPGQKGVKTDWQATWRNWCRNAKQSAKPSQPVETYKERDARLGREKWERMTGQQHPENNHHNVLDVFTTELLEIGK